MVNHVVTILGTSSYTSGAQLCKGAAAILNKKPSTINSIPAKAIEDVLSVTSSKLNIDSILVKPVKE